MNREVELILSGLHADATDENAKVETVQTAEYFKRNGSHFILYEEQLEGAEQSSRNRIKFRENLLEVTRQGLINTHMIFEENKKHRIPYATPYGELLLGIETKSVRVQEQENRILVTAKYTLESDGVPLTDSMITLEIRDKTEKTPCR